MEKCGRGKGAVIERGRQMGIELKVFISAQRHSLHRIRSSESEPRCDGELCTAHVLELCKRHPCSRGTEES